MGIIAFIILGLLAGLIAKAIMPGSDPGGYIVTAAIGIVGALLGGFIAGAALCWFFLKSKKAMRPLAPDEWGLEAAWRPLKTTSVTELWRNRP